MSGSLKMQGLGQPPALSHRLGFSSTLALTSHCRTRGSHQSCGALVIRPQPATVVWEVFEGATSSEKIRSPFRRDAEGMDLGRAFHLEFKDPAILRSIKRPGRPVAAQDLNPSLKESYRPRGTFPAAGEQCRSVGSVALQDSASFKFEAKQGHFPSEQNSAEARFSEQRNSTAGSSQMTFEPKIWRNETGVHLHSGSFRTSVVHNQLISRVKLDSASGEEAVLRGSDNVAQRPSGRYRPSGSFGKTGSRIETSYMIADQHRNSQNGAHPPFVNDKYHYVRKQISSPPLLSRMPSDGGVATSLNIHQVRERYDFGKRIGNSVPDARAREEDYSRDIDLQKHRVVATFESAKVSDHGARNYAVPPRPNASLARWAADTKKYKENKVPVGVTAAEARSNHVNFHLELEVLGSSVESGLQDLESRGGPQVNSLESFESTTGELPAVLERVASDDFALEESSTTGHSLEIGETDITAQSEQQGLNRKVLVVSDVRSAEMVVGKLRADYRDLIHACDTEVAGIDVKKESPVGHGRLICFSIYCGPRADFGEDKCRVWVDVISEPAVLDVFRSYFEDAGIKKIWHNYSFDKHILANHGINAQGFHADTMHLARLHDSARSVVQGGYSLEGLTSDKNIMSGHWDMITEEESGGKRSMKQLFGKANIKKSGEDGKLRVVPPVEELQMQPESRDKWIQYSSFDTMEAEGMMLDRDHLARIEEVAVKQQEFSANEFKKWAAKRCPDAIYMNVGSDAQIRQLLFGGKGNRNESKKLEMERIFHAPNTDEFVEDGKKSPKKTRPFTLKGLGVDIPVDSYTSGGWPAVGGAALKALAGKVAIDYTMLDQMSTGQDPAIVEETAVVTSTGVKGGSDKDLSVYGKAYKAFGGDKAGREACMAFAALCEVASINTLISNFIQPLQGSDIKGPDGRVHCSLNINTETGRLSARRPSLQNQPALEKDRYKIRQAFVAAPGNSLIVADYGQLELRILAHLTDCKSMLEAFEDGGDFHSRTAMNMYPHVRNAVEKGDVLLEWDPKPGQEGPPAPLLKDVFGAERRKAKMLNFSIAYGKTAVGLSKDWKVSLPEAKSTVDLWYSDRQEVLQWQRERQEEARITHHVYTLLGRKRHFPDVKSESRLVRGHIERAAINTPVQGSAADVAMLAMLEISRNTELQQLGWKLILQVHDEVILEGPSESADRAKDLVVQCMSYPFKGKNHLRVALAVDAKSAGSWYAAK